MTQRPSIELLTFGCRLNLVESQKMQALAEANGLENLAIVNSCAVTAESVRQTLQAIRRLGREKPHIGIIVTGCASEIDPKVFEDLPKVIRLIPNAHKTKPEAWGGKPAPRAFPQPSLTHTRAFIEVQNGCDHACTFCTIPAGRGASRSKAMSDVIQEIAHCVDSGIQDVILTGVDLTSWGADLPLHPKLGQLLEQILVKVPHLPRLRLSSLDCIEIDPLLQEILLHEPRFMPHLHLSLQSGNDLILKRMKRRHQRADVIKLCTHLHHLRPDLVLGADFIAGFPTETEEMFAQTLDLVRICHLTHLHVFPYSARPHTPAARMPQLPIALIKERAERLRLLGEQQLSAHLQRHIGRTLSVLMERGGMGRAEDFTSVRLEDTPENIHLSSLVGQILPLTINGHDGRKLLGKLGNLQTQSVDPLHVT